MDGIVQGKLEDLARLCGRHSVRRLELFGSAARGQAAAESDLDFLVEFQELSLGKRAMAYFGLLEGLQGLFGRPVDLVMTSAIRNPYFTESIRAARTLLYAA